MILWAHNQRRWTHAQRAIDDGSEPHASCRPVRRHEDDDWESDLFHLADHSRRTEQWEHDPVVVGSLTHWPPALIHPGEWWEWWTARTPQGSGPTHTSRILRLFFILKSKVSKRPVALNTFFKKWNSFHELTTHPLIYFALTYWYKLLKFDTYLHN